VIRYIEHQEEHHRKGSFEEEYIDMLTRAGIEYAPEYVFDLNAAPRPRVGFGVAYPTLTRGAKSSSALRA
jgi:hypothetical protein